jgi:hypothetical protein
VAALVEMTDFGLGKRVKAKADPYGMTTKRAKAKKQRQNQKQKADPPLREG